jgi:hypothetical protein
MLRGIFDPDPDPKGDPKTDPNKGQIVVIFDLFGSTIRVTENV